jgi:hypothetical protein
VIVNAAAIRLSVCSASLFSASLTQKRSVVFETRRTTVLLTVIF